LNKPTFKDALQFWIKLGFISFGGPAGQIAIMHEYLVEKKKWISESKFLHALNYCMILPGPEAQQLATYIGWLLHGTIGGLAAGILFVLPSVFILLTLSILYVTFGSVPWIYAIFAGLKPAVVAIVILALIKIGKRSLIKPIHFLIAIASFVAIFIFNIPFPIIILSTIIFAIVFQQWAGVSTNSSKNDAQQFALNESEYFINQNFIAPVTGLSWSRLFKQVGIFAVLWISPIVMFQLWSGNALFWETLSVFFTKAAFVTFGGAYAVLPYVAQVSVEKFEWLSKLQMLDGLALGETTPGPLIMVLAFVGFMAGYNHFGFSIAMGSIGLLTTTWYTFLPCFFFIFAGAPLIEKSQESKKIKTILSLVAAAVVGVILNLTLYFGKAVIFFDKINYEQINLVAAAWVVVSVVALHKFKVNIIVWIAVSGLFGLLHYLVLL
jgi:chromate transporter